MHTKGVRPISTAIVADTTPIQGILPTMSGAGCCKRRWKASTACAALSPESPTDAMVKDRFAGLNAMQWGNPAAPKALNLDIESFRDRPCHLRTFAESAHHVRVQSIDSIGAGRGSRTPDLLITNQLLYQLSYAGDGGRF